MSNQQNPQLTESPKELTELVAGLSNIWKAYKEFNKDGKIDNNEKIKLAFEAVSNVDAATGLEKIPSEIKNLTPAQFAAFQVAVLKNFPDLEEKLNKNDLAKKVFNNLPLIFQLISNLK